MANKNRKAMAAAKAAEAAAAVATEVATQTPEPEVVVVVSPEPTPEVTEPTPEPVAPTPDPTPDPTPAAVACAPVYWVDADRPFTPRRGFESALYRVLAEPKSLDEVVADLLASGEYARVAPEAAAKRPVKPAKFLLKTWTVAGVLKRSN